MLCSSNFLRAQYQYDVYFPTNAQKNFRIEAKSEQGSQQFSFLFSSPQQKNDFSAQKLHASNAAGKKITPFRQQDQVFFKETAHVISYEISPKDLEKSHWLSYDNLLLAPLYSFIGSWQNAEDADLKIYIHHPPEIFNPLGGVQKIDAQTDLLQVEKYTDLPAQMLLYAPFDTTSFTLKNTRQQFLIATLGNAQNPTAVRLQRILEPVIKAVTDNLRSISIHQKGISCLFLPPEIFSSLQTQGGLALAHSSLLVLPDNLSSVHEKYWLQQLACHELMHSLLPYALRSDKITQLHSISQTEMSQHLWLYEGVTEYLSLWILAEEKIISQETFFNMLASKIAQSENLPVSLAQLSREIYQPNRRKYYPRFYDNACVVAFALDIMVRKYFSDKNLCTLLLEIAEKYAPAQIFPENDFYHLFGEATNSEIEQFLVRYVAQNTALPVNRFLADAAWQYQFPQQATQVLTYGEFSLRENANAQQILVENVAKNAFGLQENDVIVGINFEAINVENYANLLDLLLHPTPAKNTCSLQIQRKGEKMSLKGIALLYTEAAKPSILAIRPTNDAQRSLQAHFFEQN